MLQEVGVQRRLYKGLNEEVPDVLFQDIGTGLAHFTRDVKVEHNEHSNLSILTKKLICRKVPKVLLTLELSKPNQTLTLFPELRSLCRAPVGCVSIARFL